LVRETRVTPHDFIAPFFVTHGERVREPIPSMPGVDRVSVDLLVEDVREIAALGVPAILLFGIPAVKDAVGSESHAPDGIIQRAIRAVKAAVPEITVVTDVCLCEYTDHGHCGLLHGETIANDETLPVLQHIAISHAEAGADVVAPSGMMDGAVRAIREALDAHGFDDIAIMAYAVKYSSAFYGPFRDAAGGAPKFGDRRTHQMDPANVREALREAALDVEEGADFLMVKPAMAYLDVVARVRDLYPELPLVAYNVSGEYAMLKAAGAAGWIDERAAVLELLHSIKRAGADAIITYHAKDACQWLGARTAV
jgi:porphobilinogen synthase